MTMNVAQTLVLNAHNGQATQEDWSEFTEDLLMENAVLTPGKYGGRGGDP